MCVRRIHVCVREVYMKRKDNSGNGRQAILSRCDWLRSWREVRITMEGREETHALQRAIGVLTTILSSSETVPSLSSSLEQRRTSSSGPNVPHSTAESEMREPFRPRNSQVAPAAQAANVSASQGQTGGLRQSLRYETQRHFGNWGSRKRKR